MNTHEANTQNTIIAVIRKCQTHDNQAGKTSVLLMQLAGEFDLNFGEFGKACKKALKAWKDTPANNGKPTPRTFTQMKSNIIGAMKLKINPADFETERALRKAVQDARKKLNPKNELTIRAGMQKQIQQLNTSELGDAVLATLIDALVKADTQQADNAVAIALKALDKALNPTVAKPSTRRAKASTVQA